MTRRRLPGRRYCENFTLWHEGQPHDVTLGFFQLNGRIAEVFIDASKVGSAYNLLMKEAAILISLAIQHGISFELIRTAMPRKNDGTAEGLVGVLLDRIRTMEARNADALSP